ncbi:hypothetical protein V6N12_010577 [Hibiscus sabdariffa]|uniref:Uncharacterized protein n=1 Tax=Hibiscus sabdariffa TaxID=183260 RepID=A0ABR2EKH5_9ROSI
MVMVATQSGWWLRRGYTLWCNEPINVVGSLVNVVCGLWLDGSTWVRLVSQLARLAQQLWQVGLATDLTIWSNSCNLVNDNSDEDKTITIRLRVMRGNQ